MDKIEKLLSRKLYRTNCPETLLLGEYILKTLDADETDRIKEHLGDCPYCRQEIRLFEAEFRSLGEISESPAENPIQKARKIIAKLMDDSASILTGGQLAPVPVGVRGIGEEPLIFDARDWQISMEVQEDTDNPGYKSVFGFLLGDVTSGHVELQQAGETLTQAEIDDLSSFMIKKVNSGTFDLVFILDDTQIFLQIEIE